MVKGDSSDDRLSGDVCDGVVVVVVPVLGRSETKCVVESLQPLTHSLEVGGSRQVVSVLRSDVASVRKLRFCESV